MRRWRTAIVCAVVAAVLASPFPVAQGAPPAYPVKPVRVLVGLAPGGATDVQARWFSQKLTISSGRQFVVDNRAGAGGLVAYRIAVAAPAEGYTLLVVTPGLTIAPALQEKAAIDPSRELAPISLLTTAPFLLVVTPSLPVKSTQELIAYAKARPRELIMGVSGRTAINLGAVWFAQATGTKITIVTYKGNAPALTDVLAGQVHATFSNMLSSAPFLKTGRLLALAVTSLERISALPDLPTVAEAGVRGFDVSTWHGWAAPRGTPPAVIKLLREELKKAVAAPEIAERLSEEGSVSVAGSPESFAQHIAGEITRWEKLVKETGLKVD
jgi:tripartite-type tricarboxylate transporter receptor subunit TctC